MQGSSSPKPKIVIDTNVLVAAFRSSAGASSRLLSLVGSGKFETHISVPLIFEYEEVLLRQQPWTGLSTQEVERFVDYLCAVGRHRKVYYLWRPYLADRDDDMVLETAVAGGCRHIVTFNKRDFLGTEQFGIEAVTPRNFLTRIGELG